MLERVSNCLGTIPASIFERKWLMWLLTMPSLATSCSAISVPDRPMTMSESNSGSLGVSPSGSDRATVGRVWKARCYGIDEVTLRGGRSRHDRREHVGEPL